MESTSEERGQMMGGIDFGPNDPLPDIPDAGDDSVPITSPNPIDFSTDGLTYAGSVGMSTFNDGTDDGLFERTVDAYEDAHAESPFLGDDAGEPIAIGGTRRARIY